MLRLDGIIQYIVPLTFLAIWALTSLFNRETQSLPPRPNRPPGPKPPVPPATPRPPERRVEAPSRDPAMRWSATNGLAGKPPERPGARRPSQPVDDEILIIESEPRRGSPAPPARPANGGSPARRGTRVRTVPAQPTRQAEVPTARALSLSVGQGMSSVSRHLELSPLHGPPSSPLTTQETAHVSPSSPARPTSTPDSLRLLMASPAKLRETIVINELLQPPLALRNKRPGRPN